MTAPDGGVHRGRDLAGRKRNRGEKDDGGGSTARKSSHECEEAKVKDKEGRPSSLSSPPVFVDRHFFLFAYNTRRGKPPDRTLFIIIAARHGPPFPSPPHDSPHDACDAPHSLHPFSLPLQLRGVQRVQHVLDPLQHGVLGLPRGLGRHLSFGVIKGMLSRGRKEGREGGTC